MTSLPTLIADDEEGPREQLRAALQRLAPELDIVAASCNGVDAWDDALALEPRLCFLDIRMPGLSGLEVARRLSALAEPPQVVFVSAFGDHALSAFEAGAVDYVLKPVEDERLGLCLQRLRARASTAAANAPSIAAHNPLLETLRQLLPARAPVRPAPIQASVGKEIRLIPPDEVLFFQSDNRYTRVVHLGGEAWIRTPLKELLVGLDETQFWQVHRSVLVNSRFIVSATRVDESTMLLSLRGHDEKLPVSRQFQSLFRAQ
ncbi:LytTR family DNA-binding domain-containing protein [Pelomonas sp. CA6]|uniref:LytR/AlgR family response regulator transcription factor n=1 Tax=Pelomonas sp. CA6 TaxID=2907999 RepID=UPI001F4C0A6B|nr:LytTR family DNA-binding domain-containing protein [Pelomonas sp. CA6]MCH7343516.1 LytTR family DNA-binding domain-containing protein [Pelomonas sp. CA6]